MEESNSDPDHGFAALSPELISHVCSYIPKRPLLNLRSVNRYISTVVTPWAFRRVKLGAREGKGDHVGFVKIARSAELRRHVREVDVDTWVGDGHDYDHSEWYPFPDDLMNALPLLRCFRGCSALNIMFNERCGHDDDDLEIEESTDFRYRVMDTIFQSLAGTWTVARQREIDKMLSLDDIERDYAVSMLPQGVEIDGPIRLRVLTVGNLADYDDRRLTQSEAFRAVMDSGSLVDLRLYITFQTDMWAPERDMAFVEKHDMLESLHETWLTPAVARNLRVLSLFCAGYWGWCPKMDFRFVNPAEGGFPNLRVLALGNYIISHDWQVDWIASQGKDTPNGGLQELYLDDCPILFHARYAGPLAQGETVVGQDLQGDDIIVSDDDYPLKRKVTSSVPHHSPDVEEKSFPLRWSKVLSRWRETMAPRLRTFKMGSGPWHGEPPRATLDVLHERYPDADIEDGYMNPCREDIYRDNTFLNFAMEPVSPDDRDYWENKADGERWRGWRGIHELRKHELMYGRYVVGGGAGGWEDVEEHAVADDVEGLEGDRGPDELALRMFRDAVGR
ncbi:hypothetical protein ACJ41O_007661 [Fusarium nematophilum]